MRTNNKVMTKLGGLAALVTLMLTFTACSGNYNGSSAVAPAPPPAAAKSDAGSDTTNQQPPSSAPQPLANPLTAGMIDDNEAYADYLKYLSAYAGPMPALDMNGRHFVKVVDGQGQPVADAPVELTDKSPNATNQTTYALHTGSDGRVVIFPQATLATVPTAVQVMVKGDNQASKLFDWSNNASNTSVITVTTPSKLDGLDIVFLLDSTGSMGDEIDRIKATIFSISERINSLPGAPSVRFGLVSYRDRVDEYLSRHWDFSDVQTFAHNLNTVEAVGGGDTPEDFSAGLGDTLNNLSWDVDHRHALRLVFAITDAAPHIDYSDESSYSKLAAQAATMGIKIFPIAASDIDQDGEYAYRQVAAYTLAKFVFLTYANGSSGAPGKSTNLQVGQYSTSNLDELIVRLISTEVENQRGHFSNVAAVKSASQVVAAVSSSGAGGQVAFMVMLCLSPFGLSVLLIWRKRRNRHNYEARIIELIEQQRSLSLTRSRIADARYWSSPLPEEGIKVEQYRG